MRIAVDAMGGDFAPEQPIKGSVEAINEFKDLTVILVGDKDIIKSELKKYKFDSDRILIEHADDIIKMDEKDNPASLVKKYPNSSMNVALELVKSGKADANLSAGNTGALMVASQLKLKRIKGVARPAITTVFPSKKGHLVMLDAGANSECKPEFLNQFAIMATVFARTLLEVSKPKVALLNIGEEDSKGNTLTKETFKLLKENRVINFIGNIESRDMMEGNVDVVVTDGFTGNIVLKTAEGTAKFIFDLLKEKIKSKFMYKIAALILKPAFKSLKAQLDSTEYGGALFLGLNGISIKAHGNSDAKAFKNAIKVASKFAELDLVTQVKKKIDKANEIEHPTYSKISKKVTKRVNKVVDKISDALHPEANPHDENVENFSNNMFKNKFKNKFNINIGDTFNNIRNNFTKKNKNTTINNIEDIQEEEAND